MSGKRAVLAIVETRGFVDTKEEFDALIAEKGINVTFAGEVARTYGCYPSEHVLQMIWESEFGAGVREHFGVTHLYDADEIRERLGDRADLLKHFSAALNSSRINLKF